MNNQAGHKYTNTNTQIQVHKYTNTQRDPLRGVQGEKASISSWLLLEQPGRPQVQKYKYTSTSTQTHKYTNTQIEIHKCTKRSFERGSGGKGINSRVASSDKTSPATNTHMFCLTSIHKCKRRNANYLKIEIPKNCNHFVSTS